VRNSIIIILIIIRDKLRALDFKTRDATQLLFMVTTIVVGNYERYNFVFTEFTIISVLTYSTLVQHLTILTIAQIL